MAATPKHARQRFKKIEESAEALLEMAKDHDKYSWNKALYLMHDLLSDAHTLTTFADLWIDFCRKTGQYPYVPVNDDGSINSRADDRDPIDWSTY